jgi:pimeloyl-ACP methyl ester carboxylesterase
MADDVLAVVDALDLAPCRVVGFSLGSQVVLRALGRADGRIERAVLMGARSRRDPFGSAFAAAELELHDSGTTLPPSYRAMVKALQYLSPATLAHPRKARDWLQIFQLYGGEPSPAMRHQLACSVDDAPPVDHASIDVPVLVVSFAEDRVTPAALGRELATLLPRGAFHEIADAGHYGHLERPAEVNEVILRFLATPAEPLDEHRTDPQRPDS